MEHRTLAVKIVLHSQIVLALLLATVVMAISPQDSDHDGYPDELEISSTAEQLAFREWFAAIAEAQYTATATDWEYQDCSGLLRYAFVETLKPKDAAWFAKFPYLALPHVAPIHDLSYPMPLISRSVFRISPGSYSLDDVALGRMVGLATAEELMRYSSVPLGKSAELAKRGDLLFFVHPLSEGSSYHSMIYLGNNMVVYHTGARPEDGGEVRLLSLATLGKHPDVSWHPDANNPHFLGFFRWKILD